MSNRQLIGLLMAIAVALIAVAAAALVQSALKGRTKQFYRTSIPLAAPEPKVITGEGSVSKTQVVESLSLGTVTDIATGRLDGKAGDEIGVASSEGALILNKDFSERESIPFAEEGEFALPEDVGIIDVNRDGVCEFLKRGSWLEPAELLSHDGTVRWKYSSKPGIDYTSAGDVDGDGRLEYALGLNGDGGILLLDAGGKERWRNPEGNVWHTEIIAAKGGEKGRIVYSNAEGNLMVLDARGGLVSKNQADVTVTGFSFVKSLDRSYPVRVIGSAQLKILLLDLQGRTVESYDAPFLGEYPDLKGTAVKLKSGAEPYFAALAIYDTWDRSTLYIYAPTKELVYAEILPELCKAVAAVPGAAGGTEAVLVGGKGHLWKYELEAAGAD